MRSTFKRALLALWLLLAAALPAHAVIGTPAQLGTGSVATGTAAFTITTSVNDCPVGATAIVTYGSNNTPSSALSTVADNAAVPNTWTILDAGATTGGAGVAYTVVTSDLAVGKVITITAGSVVGIKTGNAVCVSGLTATPADKHNNTSTGSAVTTATTVSTGTLSQSSELIIGVLGTATSAISAYTPGGSFTSIGGVCSTTTCIHEAWQIVSSTASVSSTPSWTTSATYTSNVASFKGAATPGGPPGTTMGVGQ